MKTDGKNTTYGPGAGETLTDVRDNILIGAHCNTNFYRCIVIGEDLTAKYSYHLLIGIEGHILVDRVMTEAEWLPTYTAMRKLFKGLSKTMEGLVKASNELAALVAFNYRPKQEGEEKSDGIKSPPGDWSKTAV